MERPEIQPRMLIVDDDSGVVSGLTALLEDAWEVHGAATGRSAIVAFGAFSPDVVLLDIELPDTSGLDLLQQFKMHAESVAVIMMSGEGSVERVVESMKLGAETFLQKPFDYDTLSLTLANVSRMLAINRELMALRRNENGHLDQLAGVSPSITAINSMLGQVAQSVSPVLIEGESGTGKGVLARLIHKRSLRSKSPFVDLNCAGLSKELLESELFGHERGAFTGAINTKPGLFEIASGGTLFLDEISEMDLRVQSRLLKAIEEKRFRRVGGVRDLSANFRLLAATNRSLTSEVAAGRFREDLFYRLNVVRILMPPLRERPEDIPILSEVLLRGLVKEIGRAMPSISHSAMKKLSSEPWPGNVRQLRNVLERALLTLGGKELRSEDLLLDHDGSVNRPDSSTLKPTRDWEIRRLEEVVADYVAAAVDAAGGNVRKAARKLDISPSTLYTRLKHRTEEG